MSVLALDGLDELTVKVEDFRDHSIAKMVFEKAAGEVGINRFEGVDHQRVDQITRSDSKQLMKSEIDLCQRLYILTVNLLLLLKMVWGTVNGCQTGGFHFHQKAHLQQTF